jgi:uroporphyrinogen III methyltransferase / synthase
MEQAVGHVWIVGGGPGDPGLITVAGAKALSEAQVVVYDALSSPALLRGLPETAERVYVGKRAGQHAMPQEEISALLVREAQAGKRVVRLKGGDPFVFGRGSEEALACRAAGVPFTVVPGITSAIAAPAYAGIPVTHRRVATNFLVITGSEAGDDDESGSIDWEFAARADTLLILMGVATLERNVAALLAAGKAPDTPVACVRWGTRPDQELVKGTLATIVDAALGHGLKSPVVTIVGEVVGFAAELAWFGGRPLTGRRIVVTRARTQASDLAARFEALGAYVVEAPVIASRALPENLPLREGVGSRWDWIVFTSANGVDAFFDALSAIDGDARSLHTTRIGAVGEATAEALRTRGVRPDFVPSKATGDVLAQEIEGVRGARVLLPVSNLTDTRLGDALRKRGALIEQLAAYETVSQPLDEERLREVAEADAITFSSASTARNLRDALDGGELREETKLVSIGAQTSAAVKDAFGRLDAEAREPSLDSLVEATVEALRWD